MIAGLFSHFLLHNHFITEKNLKKKSGDVNDEVKFPFFFNFIRELNPTLVHIPAKVWDMLIHECFHLHCTGYYCIYAHTMPEDVHLHIRFMYMLHLYIFFFKNKALRLHCICVCL